jgi:hypothetical protein
MKFEWALEKLAKGLKVRCKSWENPNSYIFVKNKLVFSHKDTKAYFFLDSFYAEDWEIYIDILTRIAEKIKEHGAPNTIMVNRKVFYELNRNSNYMVRVDRILGLKVVINNNLDDFCVLYEAPQEKFFCQYCKKEVKFGIKFCGNCGRAQM